jgi:cellulose synthase/poly-beta-1,6-N-acetylglucosamine synthase-like glycosyltransferase
MNILLTIFIVLQIVLYVYLATTIFYLFIFAMASTLPAKKRSKKVSNYKKFAVIIPGYMEDEVILDVALEAFKQNYPKDKFDIVIVADKFETSTIEKLKQFPVILFDENFKISTKTRAINHALRLLPENEYEAVCILDADNIMETDFLLKMNEALFNGFFAVQGHRVAKNLNTSFAILDAISEEINNQIFRKGPRRLGLSSALIGSAMVFDYKFFKKLMQDIEVVGGFDKELELILLRNGYKIEYISDAYVYDEKVQNVRVFTQQRRRWLSAQFHYFGIHFLPAVKALLKHGNIEYFHKAYQHMQLPRILLLGLLFFLTVTSWLFNQPKCPLCWIFAFTMLIFALILAIPKSYYRISTFKALLYLPVGFLFMLLSLLKIKGANKKFIHTKHTYNAFQIKRKK